MSDWFDQGSGGSPVDVRALLDDTLADYLAAIVSAGALVSIGTTSDGGALGVTVTLDGRWRRGYFRESDEAKDWLTGALEAVAARPPASPARQSRRRRS